MRKRFVFTLLFVLSLAIMSGTLGWAQDAVAPDKGVRGNGAIALGATNPNVGLFDINVAQTGDSLPVGGFRFAVVAPTGQRQIVIASKAITGLTIVQNKATVQAKGFLNNVAAEITVVAVDGGTTARDGFEITASPIGLDMPSVHFGGPVVKGNLVVFGAPPVPECAAFGNGAIRAGAINIGRFEFKSAKVSGVVRGSLYYTEVSPTATAISRPPAKIYIPAVRMLEVNGNTAVLAGPGYLNGQPAFVRVKVIDNDSFPTFAPPDPDEFHITATTTNRLAVSITYSAGGPLIPGSGNIVVKSSQ